MIICIILCIIAVSCFVISYLQFNEKGFLFNNAYIYASQEERETMNLTPHYRQSGIVFLLLGIIFAINAVNVILQTNWLFFVIIVIVITTLIYAIVSSVVIERKHK